MKKILKFALVIVVLCGIIALLYKIPEPSPVPPSSDNTEDDASVVVPTDFDEIKNKITSEWKNARAWDSSLYTKHKKCIIGSQNRHSTDAGNTVALQELLREKSISCVYNWYKNSLYEAKVDNNNLKSILENNYQGLKYILKDNGVDSTFRSNAVEICAIHSLYKRLSSFSVIISKQYDTSDNGILSKLYQKRLGNMINIANDQDHKGNRYYHKMSHIFDDKLDVEKHNPESAFYTALINNILTYYNKKYLQYQANTAELQKCRNSLDKAISNLPKNCNKSDLNRLKNKYDDILNPRPDD